MIYLILCDRKDSIVL